MVRVSLKRQSIAKSALAIAILSCELMASAASGQTAPHVDVRIVPGPWRAQDGITVPLWPDGVPKGPAGKAVGEYARTATNPLRFAGRPVTGVFNVADPTLTIFKPTKPGSGAAMVVFPGGGFKQLAIDLEGTEICAWMNRLGITCILLKYRVPDSNHHYDARCDCGVTPRRLTALEDAQRAIRTVRFRAHEWGIDPKKIGVFGSSAGGYLVAQTSNILHRIYPRRDPIDQVSSRPDAGIALYPGHLCRDDKKLEPGIKVSNATPPTFILHAWDDPTNSVCNSIVYARALNEAGVPTELHLFAKGGHAFALRPTGKPVSHWPTLVEGWLRDQGWIETL